MNTPPGTGELKILYRTRYLDVAFLIVHGDECLNIVQVEIRSPEISFSRLRKCGPVFYAFFRACIKPFGAGRVGEGIIEEVR